MTANMQTITVRTAAQLMNVSERLIYMARELTACDRTDLLRAVDEGRLTIHAALKIAKPEKYAKPRDGFGALANAWNNASQSERARFLVSIREARQ